MLTVSKDALNIMVRIQINLITVYNRDFNLGYVVHNTIKNGTKLTLRGRVKVEAVSTTDW